MLFLIDIDWFFPTEHDDFFVMSRLLGNKYSFDMTQVVKKCIRKIIYWNPREKIGLNIPSTSKIISKEMILKTQLSLSEI